jgi:hypothetical protein
LRTKIVENYNGIASDTLAWRRKLLFVLGIGKQNPTAKKEPRENVIHEREWKNECLDRDRAELWRIAICLK